MKAKVTALVSIVFLVVMPLFSQETKQQYIIINDYQNLPIITINNIDDFEYLIDQNRIRNIYLYIQDVEKNNTFVVIQVGELFYRFILSGYLTIEEYKVGIKSNFINGHDYYDGQKIGIEDGLIYYYYKKNKFETLNDCKDSYSKGYIFEEYSLPSIIIPIELSSEQANFASKYIYLIKKQFNEYYKNGKCDDISKTVISRTVTNSYKTDKIEIKEYQLYYVARIFTSDYKQYLLEYDARINGYLSSLDKNISENKGYKKGTDYYEALNNEFNNSIDFYRARKMGIEGYVEYTEYKKIIDSLTEISIRKSINEQEALVLYFIQRIDYAKQISIDKLSEYCIFEFGKFQKLNKYNSNFNKELFLKKSIESIILKIDIKEIGKYDKGSGIFEKYK